MEESKTSIDFANFNYIYGEFQQQYKLKCEKVSQLPKSSFIKIVENPIKIVSAMIYEYLVYVKSKDVRDYVTEAISKLENETSEDEEYKRLSEITKKNSSEMSKYNKKYYKYILKLYDVIGNYGDELTTTFMPNKSDRKKILKYINTNSFFEQFTRYKSNASKTIAEFSIFHFKEKFTYFLGFYFAYYLFVDSKTRVYCENLLEQIINIYTDEKISKMLINGYKHLSKDNQKELKDIDKTFHNAVVSIFLQCNVSYSNYGVIPKVEEKIKFDDTLI